MEYKTRKWHDKCFQCVVCKTQVGSKPFIIPNETDVYCVGCFEEKFATKCTKCKKIMTTGGVTFKNEVWSISGEFFDNERLDSLDRQWGSRWANIIDLFRVTFSSMNVWTVWIVNGVLGGLIWSISGDFFDNECLDSLDRQWGCRWSTNPLGCREDNDTLRDNQSSEWMICLLSNSFTVHNVDAIELFSKNVLSWA